MRQVELNIGEKVTLDVRDAVEDSALAERLYAQGGQWGASHQAIKIVSSAKNASTLEIEGQFEGKSVVRFVPQSPILRHQVGVIEFEVTVKEERAETFTSDFNPPQGLLGLPRPLAYDDDKMGEYRPLSADDNESLAVTDTPTASEDSQTVRESKPTPEDDEVVSEAAKRLRKRQSPQTAGLAQPSAPTVKARKPATKKAASKKTAKKAGKKKRA